MKELNPGSIIILDNDTFHKKSAISTLATESNCRVIFLPPYSPDLNPIEKKWAWLKRKLREILNNFDSFDEALIGAFLS